MTTDPSPVPRAVRPIDVEHDQLMARAEAEHQARVAVDTAREAAVRARVLHDAAVFVEAMNEGCGRKLCGACTTREDVADALRDAASRLAAEQTTETQDTLPAWLYQRFAVIHGCPAWDQTDDSERAYWEHHAQAVRRAVERGGFKADAERPAVAEQPDTQTPEARRCPAKHGALGRICELPLGHPGMHTGSGPNGGAVWDGDAP